MCGKLTYVTKVANTLKKRETLNEQEHTESKICSNKMETKHPVQLKRHIVMWNKIVIVTQEVTAIWVAVKAVRGSLHVDRNT